MRPLSCLRLCCLALLLQACANIQNITGGPEDLAPPQLVSAWPGNSPLLNFSGREIHLQFDEWIRLDNPTGNIAISPPVEFPLKTKLRGKVLSIAIDEREVLRPQTTYTLQFGEAIRDITKGNVQRKLNYVFSTGNFIDSLRLRGSVADAFSGKSTEGMLVSLFREGTDSALLKGKPLYYTWTDEAGQFTLDFLAAGRYEVFALEDKNKNFLLDKNAELVGFSTAPVELNENAEASFQVLAMSLQPPLLRTAGSRIRSGVVQVKFTRSPVDAPRIQSSGRKHWSWVRDDSLVIWNGDLDEQTFVITAESHVDTFVAGPLVVSGTGFVPVLSASRPSPVDSLVLSAALPLTAIDASRIRCSDSLVVIRHAVIDAADPRKCHIFANWPPGKECALILDSAAMRNAAGQDNRPDTFRVIVPTAESFGSMRILLDSVAEGQAFIVHLLLEDLVVRSAMVAVDAWPVEFHFNYLLPGTYRLRLMADPNRNGRWDPGNFLLRTQAEAVYYFTLPELRADWEVNANIR
ncbi:MAG: Ig-like domain-containing protein [Saprospiraceae bacterium]|nr:Ig-like domain-containing protein [Saprospiraceae bacterium]